jgi:hypothetical protein
VAVLVASIVGGGCSFGESGVEPPLDRIFLPGGLAADPSGDYLLAVSSNSDLRFNAGTVMVVNTEKARVDLEKGKNRASWPACPDPGYQPEGAAPVCCWDFFDDRVLNCDDRAYIDPKSTVRIGSFGSRAVVQARSDMPGVSGRLYVSVRSEPSITFVELVPGANGLTLRCDGSGKANPDCDDQHKIRGDHNNMAPSALRLLEEPSAVVLDDKLGLMYVGHLVEGLSLIDTCPIMPALVSINRGVFSDRGFGITSMLLERPGIVDGSVLVTGRSFNSGAPGEVQSLSLRGLTGEGRCEPGNPSPRKVDLVQSEGFFSSVFYGAGTDIRAIVETPDLQRAYLLHRNAFGRSNPPALAEVDRSLDEQGKPRNRGIGLVETCTGATELHLYDPAPGKPGGGPRLYVVCFEAGQVYVIRPSPLEVTGVINVGRGPTTMVFSPKHEGIAYVAGFSDNNVSVLDLRPSSPTENRVVQRIGFPSLRKK